MELAGLPAGRQVYLPIGRLVKKEIYTYYPVAVFTKQE